MSGTSFSRKIIQVTFKLSSGQFTGGGSTLTVSGQKVWFSLSQVGGVASDYAHISIFGLTQSQMNQMSTYSAAPTQASPNEIEVQAGDDTGLAFVFRGTIQTANADYNSAPDVPFVVQAFQGYFPSIAPAKPTSYAGTTDVAAIMSNLASKYPGQKLTLENSGVSVKLSNPYFPGSIGDQIRSCAKAANINAVVDAARGVLAIWPKNKARTGAVVTVGPTSGLVGYPTFDIAWISFRSLWNPNIVFGRTVQLVSSVAPANKQVSPLMMVTNLQSETPDGAWFMDCRCQNLDQFTQQ